MKTKKTSRGRPARKPNLSRYQKTQIKYWPYYAQFFGLRCEMCKQPFQVNEAGRYLFCVDHSHESGKVRGLLCTRCNIFLGFIENRGDLIDRAFDYLKKDRKDLWIALKKIRIDLPHGLVAPSWKVQDARDAACDAAFQEVFQLSDPEDDLD